MDELILIKLGGSLITDKAKPFTHRPETIQRLAREITESRKAGTNIIVGHGGGSYPHQPAKKYRTHEGATGPKSWEGFAAVQDAAARLNRIVVRSLIETGEHAIGIPPSSSCIANDGKIQEWYTAPIERMLGVGLLPVVYGDVALDRKQGMCILSTEEVLGFLAGKLSGTKLIMCGKVDGVLARGKLIEEITKETYADVKMYVTGSDSIDVTGGMQHKIERALEMAQNGVTVQIINGNVPGLLKKALMGGHVAGTIIK